MHIKFSWPIDRIIKIDAKIIRQVNIGNVTDKNAFALLSYLNREQYGDRPLLTGNQYNAEVQDIEYNKPVYILNKDDNTYEIAYRKPELKFKESKILFPRIS